MQTFTCPRCSTVLDTTGLTDGFACGTCGARYRPHRAAVPVGLIVVAALAGAVLLVTVGMAVVGVAVMQAVPPADNVRCPMCGRPFHVLERDTAFPRSMNVSCQCPHCLNRMSVMEARAWYLEASERQDERKRQSLPPAAP